MAKKGKYSGGTDSSGSLVTGLVVVMGILVLFSMGLRLVIGSAGRSQPQLEATTAPTQEITPDVPAETQPEKQSLWSRLFGSKKSEEPAATQPEETEATEATGVVAQATIAVTGDILMHLPVTNTGLRSDGTYNFDSIFQYRGLCRCQPGNHSGRHRHGLQILRPPRLQHPGRHCGCVEGCGL